MRLDELNLVFMGTPEFAVPSLERLIALGCQIKGVVSQPDRRRGRGRKLCQTPVAACASRHGLPLYQWPRLNNESYRSLQALKPQLMVVVAYGKILPRRYLELPTFGCLNGHASLLPKLRGAAPIQWAVIRGHRETGISIMRMDPGMDTGDVALMRSCPIAPQESAGSLHDRLMLLSAEALEEALITLCAGQLEFQPQDHSQATMAPMLSKEHGRILWERSAQEIHDQIRGMYPWPGAWIQRPQGPLKIHAARVVEGKGQPGEIICCDPDGPRIACGEGALVLERVQRPGRRACSGASFLCGEQLSLGTKL